LNSRPWCANWAALRSAVATRPMVCTLDPIFRHGGGTAILNCAGPQPVRRWARLPIRLRRADIPKVVPSDGRAEIDDWRAVSLCAPSDSGNGGCRPLKSVISATNQLHRRRRSRDNSTKPASISVFSIFHPRRIAASGYCRGRRKRGVARPFLDAGRLRLPRQQSSAGNARPRSRQQAPLRDAGPDDYDVLGGGGRRRARRSNCCLAQHSGGSI